MIGRMISGNKKCPQGHICVFNANICTASKGKIWFGDLDLTKDKEALIEMAKEEGENIYVLREYDARFENEETPKIDQAVAVINTNGGMAIR